MIQVVRVAEWAFLAASGLMMVTMGAMPICRSNGLYEWPLFRLGASPNSLRRLPADKAWTTSPLGIMMSREGGVNPPSPASADIL